MAASIESREGFTPIDQLPSLYLQSVVAVEDHRFFAHPGFDAIATGRALVNDLKAGAIVEGGSTITQQLAKNQFFTQEQTLERKVAEVFMALNIERHFSKSEILELYVNSIYFGDGYEGVGEASQGYFGKAPSSLTDYEATLLAGVPNAPSVYAPTQNPDLAHQRQCQVLEKLVAYDYLSFTDAQRIGGPVRRRLAKVCAARLHASGREARSGGLANAGARDAQKHAGQARGARNTLGTQARWRMQARRCAGGRSFRAACLTSPCWMARLGRLDTDPRGFFDGWTAVFLAHVSPCLFLRTCCRMSFLARATRSCGLFQPE